MIDNKLMIYGSVALGSILVAGLLYTTLALKSANKTIIELNTQIGKDVLLLDAEKLNNNVLRASIEDQNKLVNEWKASNQKTLEEYNELLSKPEAVRFKTKYVEVKSNECEDIKLILDDIRINGF